MVKLFAGNKLVLNLSKTNRMKFIANNSSHSTLHTAYKEKPIEEMVNTKFLGLQIDDHLDGKNLIEQMICKLHGACHAVWLMVHISNINPLKTKHICFIQGISAYRAIKTLHFGYKNQSLNVL
jgi:hypothetical protein